VRGITPSGQLCKAIRVTDKEGTMAVKRKSKLRWRSKKANHGKRPASG
jgi:hypothetical protein